MVRKFWILGQKSILSFYSEANFQHPSKWNELLKQERALRERISHPTLGNVVVSPGGALCMGFSYL